MLCLSVPISCLGSPTSQLSPVGLLLQLESIPYSSSQLCQQWNRRTWTTWSQCLQPPLGSGQSSLEGVFGDTVKSVPVMEGDSVTLHTDTQLQADEDIKWLFGPNTFLIAEIINGTVSFSTHDISEGFRDRLKLDNSTGSLTITKIRNTDAGVYELSGRNVPKFNISVYARLPVPVISRDSPLNLSSSSSASTCVLLCSVVNVSAVRLSWYKGNSLLSSISVSGHRISHFLQLDCLNGSYSCVVAYSFTNRTTHLTNPELCQVCPNSLIMLISAAAAGFLLFLVVAIGIFWICRKSRKAHEEGKRYLLFIHL
ncbi:uncharacterized protein LOC130216577 [Danio aesculapii]|uniref:uncharacterized protein LOC130216577 n=1 Tax=Danio aesculapii TaxID=1142201 RepID=UPI0024C01613|nr:uncharacterized protein LOC130216577 [Danio aesculapii]